MALDEDAKKKISDHIESKLNSYKCPICEHCEWIPPDAIHEIRDFNFGHLKAGGTLVPVVVMTCQKCGYVLLFNAIHTQVITPKGGLLI